MASIFFPSSVTTIGNGAFSACNALTSVNVPDTVTTLGIGAFGDCDNLETATIGNGVTAISDSLFQYGGSLTTVTIGSKVATIGAAAFDSCTSLTSIIFKMLVAPTVPNDYQWIMGTPVTIEGHAYAASNFPTPGHFFHDLWMGDVLSAPTVPGAPILDSVVPGNAQVVITWHAGTNTGSGITDYKVYRNDTVAPIYTGLDLTYTDTPLINGLSYSYTVVAVNAEGDSPPASSGTVIPNIVPNAPNGLTAGSATLTSITVSWTAPTPNGGTAVTGYDVFFGTSANPTTKFGPGLDASTFSVEVTGLSPNTNYNFTVKAVNVLGSSLGSTTAAAVKTTNVEPGAPTIGTATPGLTSATVTWTAPSNSGSPITIYKVYYGKSALPSVDFVTATSSDTSKIVTGLDPGTKYYFNVVAVNAAGSSAASSDVFTTTTNAYSGAPILDSAVPGNTQVVINWHAGTNTGSPVTSYEVYRNDTVSPIYIGLLMTYTDTGLINGVN